MSMFVYAHMCNVSCEAKRYCGPIITNLYKPFRLGPDINLGLLQKQ